MSEEILDIYDIALLVNYERLTTEPRFRHGKLREIADNTEFTTVMMWEPLWTEATNPRKGFIFDQKPPRQHASRTPDLPSNMLPNNPQPPLNSLSKRELETIFYQARSHDGCYKSINVIQKFFDFFPFNVKVRIRTSKGDDYIALAVTRSIIEFTLYNPKLLTHSLILPIQRSYLTGCDPEMLHSVFGFGESLDYMENDRTILDLASMQYGDVGRGLNGRSTFVVEEFKAYTRRLDQFADRHRIWKVSQRVGPAPGNEESLYMNIAKRVKKRWDNRKNEPWCGHCGAPGKDMKRCSVCKEAHYCDEDHQMAAWPFHKRFCAGKKEN